MFPFSQNMRKVFKAFFKLAKMSMRINMQVAENDIEFDICDLLIYIRREETEYRGCWY